MKKNKSLLIFIIIIILIILSIFTIQIIKEKKSNKYSSLKELIEYYGCTYLKKTKSTEDGYKEDIFLTFKVNPINQNGESEQSFYELLIQEISKQLKNESIRIIDEEKDITIRVNYDNNNDKITYSINNEEQYFKKQLIKNQNTNQINTISVTVKSHTLISILNASWIRRSANLGTVESTKNKYENYEDEGYSIRTVGTKVFNILFMKNYNEEILSGIKTGMQNDKIESTLGIPSYEDTGNKLIGYKTMDFYIFFHEGEISIYRLEKLNEQSNAQFAKLFTALNETGDYNTFVNSLTKLYPDYDDYYKDTKYLDITYSLLGLEIKFGLDKRKWNNSLSKLFRKNNRRYIYR